jgi:hypothetical protein
MTGVLKITGRFHAAPPVADWREQLAVRLGARPRRVGTLTELALYGATACLDDAQETVLPSEAGILVASHQGALAATRTVLEQGCGDLPMPLTFLQTQPTQMLAVLAEHLGWTGDACFIGSLDPLDVLRLAVARRGARGILLGWVDETEQGITSWLRLCPAAGAAGGFRAARTEEVFSAEATHIRIVSGGLEILQNHAQCMG